MPRVRVVAHPVFARDGEPEGWRGWLAAGQRVFAEYNKFLAAWLLHLIARRAKDAGNAGHSHRGARDGGKRLAAASVGSAEASAGPGACARWRSMSASFF